MGELNVNNKIVLEIPNTKKEIEIEGKIYMLDVDDMAMVRQICELCNDAVSIGKGKIPTNEEAEAIIGQCREAIEMAFGEGSYFEICGGESKDRRYLVPLFVCSEVSKICMNEYSQYVKKYTQTTNIDEDMLEIDKYMAALAKMKKVESEMDMIK